MANKYITTPIYYVNDVPHIGHAYTTVAADTIARYWKQKLGANNVFFLTGTDEHGAKVAQSAEERGVTPKEYADQVSPRFQEAWDLLNIKYDYFIRTTDPNHEKFAAEVLQKIYDKGFIYEDVYEGLYCVGCEKFLAEADLVDSKCPLHPNSEPVHQKEKNYFFKLSLFEKDLISWFENGDVIISPTTRKNEVLGKLALGLQDISISRAGVSWGIPVPWDKSQTIYVWVEALLNYYTATKFLDNKEHFWPADLHLIGKDILWFHTVIWCALLKAADLPLPKQIFAHGFFTINGEKMSKSLGNVISPKELVDRYGVDGSRYLLLSAFPFGDDGDFSFEKLDTKFNSDLANGIGNLVARVAKLCEGIEFDHEIKPFPKDPNEPLEVSGYSNAIERLEFYYAIEQISREITNLNVKFGSLELWNKDHALKQKELPYFVGKILKLALDIKPILPETAEKIETQFKGPKIRSGTPLFPRIN